MSYAPKWKQQEREREREVQQLLYVRFALRSTNSAFYPHFISYSGQMALISLNWINQFFITGTQRVSCDVGTSSSSSSSLIKYPRFWVTVFARRLTSHETNRFSRRWLSYNKFYRVKSSALRPTLNLEDQVSVFMSSRDRMARGSLITGFFSS
jgi:hypothetical protein